MDIESTHFFSCFCKTVIIIKFEFKFFLHIHSELPLCFSFYTMGYILFQVGRQEECVSQVKWGGVEVELRLSSNTSKEPFVLRTHYSWNPIKCPKTQPSFSDSTETSHAGHLDSAFFLRLYRVHWIIWLGLFNRVTFGFSMAQIELIINYLDALIKKNLHCGFMRVCWGARTRKPLVIFSFE